MKKIIAILGRIKDFFFSLWGKIFHRRQPASTFKRGLLIGLGVAATILIVALVALYFGGVFGSKSEAKNNPIKIKITVVAQKDCSDCWDTNLFIDALSKEEFKITGKKIVYVGSKSMIPFSESGDDLVKKFNITKLPTIIIDADFKNNKEFSDFLAPNLGDIIDNRFVLRKVIPPYLDMASNQIRGKVQVTYLTDQSCKECYDVSIHDKALTNLGVPINNIKRVDIGSDEGKGLVSKYKIKAVPTLLISGEVSEYQSLVSVWKDVGTIASDGTYVFTELSVMNGVYKDLAKNKIITPTATK